MDEEKTEDYAALTRTLRFSRPDLEQSYVDLLAGDDVSALMIPRSKKRMFVFVGAVVGLYSIMLISNQLVNPPDSARLVQLTVSTIALAIVCVSLPLLFYVPRFRLVLKLVSYFSAVLSFFAFDSRLTVALTDIDDLSRSLIAFLPLLALLPFLQGLMDYRTLPYILIASSGGALTCLAEVVCWEAAYPLLAFAIYEIGCLGVAYQGYLLELQLRRDFNMSVIKPSFTRQVTMHPELQEGTVGTELEAIISDLWKVQSFLKDCVFTAHSPEDKSRAARAANLVKDLLVKIRSKNIYEVTADNLPREWDQEEVEYVVENCLSSKLVLTTPKRDEEMSATTPPKQSVKTLIPLLSQIGQQWNLDSDSFAVWAAGRPIANVSTYLFKSYQLHKVLPLEKSATRAVFRGLEERYLPNPYHNSVHATDVVMSMMFLVRETGLINHATDLELAALITSSLAHDVGHPGVNNRFLQNSQHALALECTFPYRQRCESAGNDARECAL